MIRIDVENLQEIQEQLTRLPETCLPDVKAAFSRAILAAHAGVSGRLTGDPLSSRTGLLRKSLRTTVTGSTISGLTAILSAGGGAAGVNYAAIHEYGGTVRAKNAYKRVPGGPYLNIPTRNNLTAAGVMRKTAKQVFDGGGYIAKFRSGTKYGVFQDGLLMFVLMKEVRLQPRLGMREESEKVIPSLLDDLRAIEY